MAHKLLLADDSVTIQRVIELTFADEDVQVLTAGDGEQAILRVQADRPDIVLADIGMPKRSGYEVAAFVKGHPEFSHIPVLLLTGAFEPVDEARAKAAGSDGVLVKPFEPQHVIARVRELLQGAQRRASLAGGSATPAVANVPRPVERLAPHRPMDMPQRQERPPAAHAPGDPRGAEDFEFGAPHNGPRAVGTDSLDDYFDRLDAAFSRIATPSTDQLAPDADIGQSAHGPHTVTHDESIEPPAPEIAARHVTPAAATPPVVTATPIDIPTSFANPPSTSFDWLPAGMSQPQPPPPEPPEQPATITAAASAVTSATPVAASEPAAAAPASTVADAFSALLAVEQGEPGAAPVFLTTGPAEPVITDELIDEITRRVIERLGPGAVRDAVSDIVSRVAERLVREEIARIRKR
jgi:CheY-like chemotaxis protein